MECRELTERAVALAVGEVSGPDRDELAQHCADCVACRANLASIEETWAALGSDPDVELSPTLRNRALALMEDEMIRQRIRTFHPRSRWMGPASRIVAAAAALVLAAGAGWLAHRPTSAAVEKRPEKSAGPASINGTLSNVSYRPADGEGKVAVSFDVTSHQTVVGRPEDPGVANLLAYLVSRDSQTSGERSQAIELVSSHYGTGTKSVSPEIARALATTMRKDQNPGVRKKAADALAGFPMTPEIRTAFLEALANDRNPAVRLVAVEALASGAKQFPDERTIESLREKASDPSENGFVRARAASALKAMEF